MKSNNTLYNKNSQAQLKYESDREKLLHCLKSFVPTLSHLYEGFYPDTFKKTVKRHLWPIFMSLKEMNKRTDIPIKVIRILLKEFESENILIARTIRRRQHGLWDMNCYFFIDKDDKYCFKYTTSIVIALGKITKDQWDDIAERAVTVMNAVKKTYNDLVGKLKEHVKNKYPESNWFKPKKITRADFTQEQLSEHKQQTFSLEDILASISSG